ncbi:hypothetical protein BD311DRAFT_759803 [Dichomitus squalens]|uniref:Uncharacterized protein n=1 Tax=Dichomitus squalens TaxID=114155 RepID=A0A4Q9MJE9_9APHY|nr:hypothetical protein BD311DRAFT_759803 [Dichomitus squalens]
MLNIEGYVEVTVSQPQQIYTKPLSQASQDSEGPVWTTLASNSTSDEEDVPDSTATTPEPAECQVVSQPLTTYAIWTQKHLIAPGSNQQPHNMSKSLQTNHGSISNLKRKAAAALDAQVFPLPEPLAKKTRLTPTLQTGSAQLKANPPTHPLLPTFSSQHTFNTSHTAPTLTDTILPAPCSEVHATSTGLNRRPRKTVTPNNATSSTTDWALVDSALQTRIATAHILSSYARSPPGCKPDGMSLRDEGWAHVPVARLADLGKGKRAGANVGEFKARLDMMYGHGDINRGLGRGPRNVQTTFAEAVESSIAPDEIAVVGRSDQGAIRGSALTENDDSSESSLESSQGVLRRARLENSSPERDDRASRR